MSKAGYISRYAIMLKKLRQRPYSTFEELQDYVLREAEFMVDRDDQLNIGFSKRTFQRDLKEIRNLFGIKIEYSTSRKGYYIVDDTYENLNFQRMLEAYDVFNLLQKSGEYREHLYFEERRALGTEYLASLLSSIKNRTMLELEYKKFAEDTSSKRAIKPYALKEYANRWYLIGEDTKDGVIKTFGLDRIVSVGLTKVKFVLPDDFSMEERYRNAFGIITEDGVEAEDIVLSFKKKYGTMAKTLPFHPSQEILIDTKDELRIKIHIVPAFDFINEILSWGDDVKVLQSKSLIKQVKNRLKKALKQYE
ncbi:MAG: WYL domain-containing protein [Saprospiraceae bacterium]|nr:WYL domain-containing protein [Saprospiraceae bacterium]HQW96148.1 WYL domain-containing protein [Saprospiraceae bacterium]